MNDDALNQLAATIEVLDRLYAEAKDDLTSPAWQEMQRQLDVARELLDRLRPH